ncbi:enoyl-CoA hydratase/isomerase family protein [Rhodococcus sp. NPDC003318]|uniref:enoyl-CoA hydratase/isomerase family protein n=1 Tax=Rhodococcus sp. NPDC003318 TaxID=3364503 RepID=UPI00367FA865
MSRVEMEIAESGSISTVAGILYSEEDDLAWVEINRPMAANSMSSSMVSELRAVWTSLSTNSAVKAVILVGTGTEAFTVGLDSKAVRDTPSALAMGPRECGVEQHLIVAVNGLARNEARVFLRDADVVVAAEHVAIDVDHFARNGSEQVAAAAGDVPAGRITASAGEALELGIVDSVVPLQELRSLATRIARERIAGDGER